ncbi:hypothetical protein A0130_05700 [Leifsonia xyli]|uniref:DUF4190 domain-containing protein n=1 Tax=Leifsonia xyli TaxID=1575 RepID=UPI0007CDBC6D|nr:hypothetical protein A0130_05700 [Leifsonia xyli]
MSSTQTATKFNTMAVVGFVFAFIFSPLALLFGAIGLSQIKQTGERGRALALWAVALGAIRVVSSIIKLVLLLTVGHAFGGFYDYYIW